MRGRKMLKEEKINNFTKSLKHCRAYIQHGKKCTHAKKSNNDIFR